MRHTPTCSTKLLGTRDTTFGKLVFFEFVVHIAYMGSLLLQSGASTGCCLRRVRILKNEMFQQVLPPAGQNPGK